MTVQHLALLVGIATLSGCAAQETPPASTTHFKLDGRHAIYRGRLFTAQLRGAAGIPLHVDAPDGTRLEVRADNDGRFCLIVPEVNTEAGIVAPRITADWSRINQVRPAETTRFASDAGVRHLTAASGFLVTPDRITGTERDRPPSLGLPQSEDWRGGQDDAAQCHVIEHGQDKLVANAAIPGGGPVTAQSYGSRDAALLTAARALARRTADRLDACFRRKHGFTGCDRLVRPGHRTLPGGFVDGPAIQIFQGGYSVHVMSNAGTYIVERDYEGAARSEDCHAIRVTSCPPGLAP